MEKKEPMPEAKTGVRKEPIRVADLPLEQKLYVDSVWVLSVFFIILCLWIIFVMIWDTADMYLWLTDDDLTPIMEGVAVIALLHILKKTSIRITDLGLTPDNFKNSARRSLYRIPALLGIFVGAKLIIMKLKPDIVPGGVSWAQTPFWDWKQADIRLLVYLFTSFVQELLARGGVQERSPACCRANVPIWLPYS